MARARKIPVRKHHGIRDPLKQQEQREKKLSKVTNNPPSKTDEQHVSFKFKQFQQLADGARAAKKLRLGEIGKEDKPKTSGKASDKQSASKNTRNIKQFANETDTDYLRRVNRITSASVREAQYEAKYGVNVIRNPKTGEITVQKRPKNEIDELLKQKQKEQRNAGKRGRKKTNQKPTMDAKTSKELIKRAFKEAKEEKSSDDENSPIVEYKRDTFAFGDIVHAPPALKTRPRKATKDDTTARPGRKSNLLLKSLLDSSQQPYDTADAHSPISAKPVATPTPKKSPKISLKMQMKGKRKDLPIGMRSMLETEREKMVLLYRKLKEQKAEKNT
ncbi:uncharacterized protein LOC117894806 [Drosophila subobscura]|uniref:uncharacterized protein LOC117894806 n=1 Tax=Drosophila subobscura TaxID=7241 RepID=UPI00155AB4F9|nr:uncharacterized protein LOC117894806 [Drosophila subobscura]